MAESTRVQRTERRDVVVVGSGFGASVTAMRLAAGGKDVCVLERGKAYPPGSFARSPAEMRGNFWDPGEGNHGLFDVWSFGGIDALISSGLGGGSLIYANVLLRKDEHWFVEDDRVGPDGSPWRWPVGGAELDPYYAMAEEMLHAQQFPFEHPDYAGTPKTRAMQESAQRLGLDWILPPLAITFADGERAPARGEPITTPSYGNVHGLPRVTCRMCGECDIGCNYGAKNTLDHNYLSAAEHHGAELRTRCDVRRIAPRSDGGWDVWYVEHRPAHEGHRTPSSTLPRVKIECERLVLGAGTLGTSYLVLSNRSALPGLSPMAGTRFCGNGDLLGFMTKAHHRDGSPKVIDGANGPVITSVIRLGDTADGDGSNGRGAYIQDAGYPEFANWLVEAALSPGQVGRLVGCEVLGGTCLVERGDFNLFVDDEHDVGRRWMRYRLWFRDAAGHPLTLVGFKDVHDDAGFDVWTDTSTLSTRILAGHLEPDDDADARIVAAGALTIWIRDFARRLTTFRASGPTIGDRVRGLRMFVGVFTKQLQQVYLCRRRGA